jgi:hypothetical protein
MGEENGMERRDGNLTGTATIKEEVEEGTAIKPILAGPTELGEIVLALFPPEPVFQKYRLRDSSLVFFLFQSYLSRSHHERCIFPFP